MGRLHTEDVLENHLKDQSFRLVHWLSINLFLRKTSQESINLERKFYLDCSLDTLCKREGIWKGDTMVADIQELETMNASEIYSERLSAKEVIFSLPKWKNPFSVADGRVKFVGRDQAGTENIHLDTGPPNSRRRSKRFSWRIRRGLHLLHLKTHIRMPVKLEMISGPCQEASYTAIALNPESNFTRREKNHSLLHWNTLMYPELLIQIWMSSKRNASMIIGISMDQELCLILGQVSLSSLYQVRHLGGTWQNGKRHPGQIIYGQNCGEEWQWMLSWGRGINGQLKNPNSLDSEFKEIIKKCKRKIGQHPWLQPCFARHARHVSMGSVAILVQVVGVFAQMCVDSVFRACWPRSEP